jgi:U6 snRNA-associated Sm-like protein LSm4
MARTTQLPLGLLTAAQGHPMLVELKNGETLNGHLANCDNWMNLILKEVVQTSPEGDRFFRLPEVYIRGNNVRCLGASSLGETNVLDQISTDP